MSAITLRHTIMPNPTGDGIRQILGGEPAGKISLEEAKAAIHATLIKGERK
jgi:hypothetical protein